MALLFADVPFYNSTFLKTNKRWTCVENGSLVVQTTGGPFGDKFIEMSGYNHATINKSVGGTATTLMLQFRYKITYRAASRVNLCQIREGSTVHMYAIDDNDIITFYNGGGAVLGSTSNPAYFAAWNYVEIKLYSHDTAGTLKVKLNGVTELDLSSKDTRNGGTPKLDTVLFGGCRTGNNGGDTLGITHVVVMDTSGSYCNDLIGDKRVQAFRPTGAGNYSEFTPSTGSNYANVDEDPPNDGTDYNTSDALNERDTFVQGDISNTNATISAVDCVMYCKTNDGGSAGISGMARSSSSDGLGPEKAVPASYGFVDSPIYLDPNGSAAWTPTSFNAAEFGYKRTS